MSLSRCPPNRQQAKVTIGGTCSALHFDRSTCHYRSRRTNPAFLKKRIKDICETHVRYGYRRMYYILRRDGWHVNQKKVYRLYRELSLQLRNKTPNRRVKAKLREDRAPAIRRMMCGRWTSFTTSWRRVGNCAS